jgi:hypothetical protein
VNDVIWSELLLWRDINHNGISEPDEITAVAGSSLTRIDLTYHWTGRRDLYGNLFKYESTVAIQNPSGRPRSKPVYDIFFVPVQ